MNAVLGFDGTYQKSRPVPQLFVWIGPERTSPPNDNAIFVLHEIDGEDGNLRGTLKQLIRPFLEKFASQRGSIDLHVEVRCFRSPRFALHKDHR